MSLTISLLTQGNNASNIITTASVSPTSGGVVYLWVVQARSSGFPNDTPTVTGCGLTWSQLATGTYASRRRWFLYRGTGTPSSGAISFDNSATTIAESRWHVVQITGQDTDPNGTVYTNTVNATSVAVTVTETPDTGDAVLAFFAKEASSGSVSLEGSLTELGSQASAGSDVRWSVAGYDSAAPIDTTPSASWSGASNAAGVAIVVYVGSGGGLSITQSSRFDNTNTFYSGTVSVGAVTVSQTTRFDNTNAFYGGVVSQGGATQNISQSSRFNNANAFYAGTVTPGAVSVTQSARFNNANTFYAGTINTHITVSQTSRFNNSNAFYGGVVSQTTAQSISQNDRFNNINQFFGGALSFDQTLNQDQIFVNNNRFFPGRLTNGGGGGGWGREREILEESLARFHLKEIKQSFAKSDRKIAKKIAKKIEDYSGDIEQAESLLKELERLENLLLAKTINKKYDKERDYELKIAVQKAKQILEEEEEMLEALELVEQQEIELLMRIVQVY